MAAITSRPVAILAAQASQLEVIRKALTSIESCTSSTHTLLNAILFPSSSTNITTSRTGATKTTKKKPASVATESEKGLSAIERYRLATEIVNGTLRTLNAASKVPQEPGEAVTQETVQDGKARKTTKAGTQPLRSKNLNRASQPGASQQHPALWTAECSCLAIKYIYSAQNSSEIPPIPPLQIETAQHNLITRLIILKLYDLALRELTALKRRLEGFTNDDGSKTGIGDWLLDEAGGKENKRPTSKPAMNGVRTKTGDHMKNSEENIAWLLTFKSIPPTGAVLELTIGFQFSVIRCIAGVGKQDALESLVAFLSSHNNMLSLLNTLPNPAPKLAALDSLLLSCCPSISSSADATAKSPSPRVALQLQTYALEARVLSKTKNPDEYWGLLAKFLSTFCRRCSLKEGGKERYKVVKEVTLRLQRTISGDLPENILHLLSTTAQESGFEAEALNWIEQTNAMGSQKANEGGKDLSEAAKAARSVKIAALALKSYSLTLTSESSAPVTVENITSIVDKVKNAVQAVDSITKVRAEDLERLLQEVALFRRGATLVAITPLPPVTQESRDLQAARKDLQDNCVRVSEMAIRYFRNYTLLQPNNSYKVRRLAAPAVDFITAKFRQLAGTGGQVFLDEWEYWDKTLNLCLDLMRFLVEQETQQKMETDSEQAKEDDSNKESEFEKISTAYWKAACAFRKADTQREGFKAMKRSVNALIGRPKEETIRGGLASKLEKLANGYYQIQEISRAEEAYVEGIKTLTDEGILHKILNLADNACLSEIFGEDRVGTILGKMLEGVVKCTLKDATKKQQRDSSWDQVPYDNEHLNREIRGLLLEWELRVLCGFGRKNLTIIKAVVERLLEMYTDEEPLRRARVISKILKLQIDNSSFMDATFVLGLGDEIETFSPLNRDASLKPWKNDIISSCLVSHAFLHYQSSEPRPDILQTALVSWRNTVESCSDWDRLIERIEDPEDLMAQLYMLVEFFELKGLNFHRITALRSLVLIRGIEINIDYNALVKLHTLLGIQYLRMGYSGKAGMVFAKANNWIEKDGVLDETKVQWHVGYTEYLVGIGNTDKAKEHYEQATEIVNGDTSIFESRKITSKLERRVMLNRMIADTSYVMSLLCFELGNLNDSLCHARRCIRLNQRSWAVLEQLSRDSTATTTKDSYPQLTANISNPSVQRLVEGIGRLSVSQQNTLPLPVQSMTLTALNAPLLWTLVTSLYLSLVQVSLIYRHQGMIREAIFNMEQALKTVEAVGATPLIAQALSIFGDLKIRAGALSEGADMLEKATELRSEIDKSKEIVSLDCMVGYLHGKNRLWEEEWGAYEHADLKLAALMSPGFIKNIDELALTGGLDDDIAVEDADEEIMPEQRGTTRQRTPTGKRVPTHSRTKSATSTTRKPIVPARNATKPEKTILTECSSLLKMKGNILRLKAYNLAMQSQVDQADLLLQEAGKLPSGYHEIIYQRLAAAKHLLLEGLVLLASDPVFCVLQDSTISLPSVALSKVLTTNEVAEEVSTKASTRGRRGKPTKESEGLGAQNSPFVDVLIKARDIVAEIHLHTAKVGSTAMVHSVSMLFSGIIVLLSALNSGKGNEMCNPLIAGYSVELSKGLPLLREKDAIQAEIVSSTIETLDWPQISPFQHGAFKPVSTPFVLSSFQQEYIDIIPPGWAAVSIALSEAQDELYISRFEANQGQFMLRLPLTRHNAREDSEEIFEYATGIETLKEILEKANLSTHAAKAATGGGKASKTEWWVERESLDAQLGELLVNIEHCWLGGFKGIFGQYPRHPELLKRFRAVFEKILSKHLPSRQPRRGGKKSEVSELVKIDPRVLDLFIGLGDPAMAGGENHQQEQEDMDASLLDLLWFVFDILQFHGERNAYDEIDVDEIVVDVREALRAYYQQLSYLSKSEQEIIKQTILILDKNVHIIPWESLPCLSGHAISRLPSIASLRSILTSKKMDSDQVNPGIYVDENKGTWILNPGGDLTSTQGTFEKDLLTLPGNWVGISSRAPSEAEFVKALAETDILLYFGHGSGGQFIRARTIKKLDECAVALLMGCSSGALKDAGEFQPHGMVLAYLLGGSAAVVANLWDVTDKDIDKFCKKVLEEWGLIRKPEISCKSKTTTATPARNRSKSRAPKIEKMDDGGLFGNFGTTSGKGKTSLVEAVAKGRKECHLKYLNGAAPVVYGVPVYLA